MAAELQVFEDASGIQSREVYVTNVSGEAVVQATLNTEATFNGGAVFADSYTLELAFDSGMWTGTVTPATGTPYAITPFSAPIVGALAIIPGLILEIGELEPELTYRSVLEVGWHAGTLVAGATGTAHRLYARNIGEDSGTDARVLIRPDAFIRNLSDQIAIAVVEDSLDLTAPVGVWSIELVTAPPYTFAVAFNGEPLGELEGTEVGPQVHLGLPDGPTVVFDGAAVALGPVEVEVSAGFQDFQLAADVAGAPGTWVGPELVLGALDPDESVPFWIRVQSAPERSASGNPYTAQLQTRIVSV